VVGARVVEVVGVLRRRDTDVAGDVVGPGPRAVATGCSHTRNRRVTPRRRPLDTLRGSVPPREVVVGRETADDGKARSTLSLHGIRVGVTAHRKGRELAAALERRGARVLHGPTLAGDSPAPDHEILADTEAVLDAGPDWVVASTGVGVRLWADAAEAHGRLGALRDAAGRARCVARGAKAVGGLQSLGVQPVWSSAAQTDADVAGWLARRVLPGEVVAWQLHGAAVATTFDPVVEAGADVLSVVTYRHALPDDLAPALRLLDALADGELDLVTFTSPGAARNLLHLAREHRPARADDLVEALRTRVATAVIGPVTSSALEEAGIPAWVTPSRSRTGQLLRSLEAWALRRDDVATVPPRLRLLPASQAVRTPGGEEVELGERGYAVLAALARRPGVVCSPEQLLAEAWGHAAPADPSAVKHHVARLRRKLTDRGVEIRTVRGVGYRLESGAPT
jgi:uroporphyrinogen-III synthase